MKAKVSRKSKDQTIPNTSSRNIHIEQVYSNLIEKAAKRKIILSEIQKVTNQIENYDEPVAFVAKPISNPIGSEKVLSKVDLERKLESLSIELKNIEKL